MFQGDYFLYKSNTLECVNLPPEWFNRTSSVLTNGCVVLFTEVDCKHDSNTQIFSSLKNKFFDLYSSHPDQIPNYNFFGKE